MNSPKPPKSNDRARIADGHYDFPLMQEVKCMGWIPPESQLTVSLRGDPDSLPWFSRIAAKTPGQAQRRKRNLLIYWAATRGGFPQRFIGEGFGLPKSQIGEIVQKYKELECSL